MGRLIRYPLKKPGAMAVWALVALVLYIQWPMLKGMAYRASGAAPPKDTVPWRSDFEAATTESRQTGRPLLLDFGASWCPACVVMQYDVWPDPRVRELAAKSYVPVAVDVDQDPALAQRYGIAEIPQILILDSQGKVVHRDGYMTARAMVRFLEAGTRSPYGPWAQARP